MKPSQVFDKYRAIKQHFTSSYDYFKYQGKMRYVDLSKRNDRQVFTRLAHKLQDKDVEPFFVSHMLENPKQWVGEMMGDDIFPLYKKKMLHFQQVFKDNINTIIEFAEKEGVHPAELFETRLDNYPYIVKLVQQGYIELETYIVLNQFMNLQKHYDVYYNGDFVMEDFSQRVVKYTPFVNVSIPKYYETAKTLLGENHDV